MAVKVEKPVEEVALAWAGYQVIVSDAVASRVFYVAGPNLYVSWFNWWRLRHDGAMPLLSRNSRAMREIQREQKRRA